MVIREIFHISLAMMDLVLSASMTLLKEPFFGTVHQVWWCVGVHLPTTAVAQLVNAPLLYVGGLWIKAELCQSFPRPPPTQEMAVNWVVLAFTREFR